MADDERNDVDKAEDLVAAEADEASEEEDDLEKAEKRAEAEAEREAEIDSHGVDAASE